MTIENKEIYNLYKCVKFDKTRNQLGLYFEGFVGGITVYATDGKAVFKKTFNGNNKKAFLYHVSDWTLKTGETGEFKSFDDGNGRENIIARTKEYFEAESFNQFTVDYKEFRQALKAVDTVNIGSKTEFRSIVISGKEGKINLASWCEDADGVWQLDGNYNFNGAVCLARNYLNAIKGSELAFSCSKEHNNTILHIKGEYECIIMTRRIDTADAAKFLEVLEYEYNAPENRIEPEKPSSTAFSLPTFNEVWQAYKENPITHLIDHEKELAKELENMKQKKPVKPERKPAVSKEEKERAYWTARGWTYNEKKLVWQKACNW